MFSFNKVQSLNKIIPPGLRRGSPATEPGRGTGHPPSSGDPPSQTQSGTTNVILFGETGVGKSSVINLIAQGYVAKVSSDVNGCTMESTPHNISFDDMNYTIFDTIGLEEPEMGVNGYLTAIEKAFELISKLEAAGGIHLLLFCMRGGRITATAQSNYRMFYECLCDKRVPIALVFTGLEREEKMDDWWGRNESHIAYYGIRSQGHACITAVHDGTSEELAKYKESQKKIRLLIRDCALKSAAIPDPLPWIERFAMGMMGFLKIKRRQGAARKKILKMLMQRCHLAPDVAERIADMMGKPGGNGTEQTGNVIEQAGNETEQAGSIIEQAGSMIEQAGNGIEAAGNETEQAGNGTEQAANEGREFDKTAKATLMEGGPTEEALPDGDQSNSQSGPSPAAWCAPGSGTGESIPEGADQTHTRDGSGPAAVTIVGSGARSYAPKDAQGGSGPVAGTAPGSGIVASTSKGGNQAISQGESSNATGTAARGAAVGTQKNVDLAINQSNSGHTAGTAVGSRAENVDLATSRSGCDLAAGGAMGSGTRVKVLRDGDLADNQGESVSAAEIAPRIKATMNVPKDGDPANSQGGPGAAAETTLKSGNAANAQKVGSPTNNQGGPGTTVGTTPQSGSVGSAQKGGSPTNNRGGPGATAGTTPQSGTTRSAQKGGSPTNSQDGPGAAAETTLRSGSAGSAQKGGSPTNNQGGPGATVGNALGSQVGVDARKGSPAGNQGEPGPVAGTAKGAGTGVNTPKNENPTKSQGQPNQRAGSTWRDVGTTAPAVDGDASDQSTAHSSHPADGGTLPPKSVLGHNNSSSCRGNVASQNQLGYGTASNSQGNPPARVPAHGSDMKKHDSHSTGEPGPGASDSDESYHDVSSDLAHQESSQRGFFRRSRK